MTIPPSHSRLAAWPVYFFVVSLEAAAALLALASVPSEGGKWGLGFSPARWLLVAPLFFIMAGSLVLSLLSRRPSVRLARWLELTASGRWLESLAAASALLAAGAGIGSFLMRWYDPARLLPFFERAWPLLAFFILFGSQTALFLLVWRFGIRRVAFDTWRPALVAFVILLLTFSFVALTRLGLTPDKGYWGEPGVPIQTWQLGLALLGGVLFLTLRLLPFFERRRRLLDFLLPLLVWALAVGIWSSVPNTVLKNSFYFPIDPPANTPFPYSDAGYYDYMAHSVLIGTAYMGEIPTRPLYIVFLAFLHAVFGERYDLIILGQTLVLAFIPVVLYMLGKAIHSQTAGLTIALLAIFREWTALLVSSQTRVSNVKMLLVDLPTLLFILLACWLAFRWLAYKGQLRAFLTGGTFGILLLLRTQSMLILPILFLVAFWVLRSQPRSSRFGPSWLVSLAVFLLGMACSTMPWLTHNYLHSGHVSFDTSFEYQVIASQYTYDGLLNYGNTSVQGKSLLAIMWSFFWNDPPFVIGFILNHFLATEVGALLALPLIAPFEGLRAPVNVYWTAFDGRLSGANILLLFVYLGLVAIGLGAAWQRWRWAGLLPLAFSLGYALANGLGRFSGWRYDLPADWIAYFYFGIGVAEILIWVSQLFGALRQEESPPRPTTGGYLPFAAYALSFALLGSVPWLAKSLNPPRYPDLAAAAIQERLSQMSEVQALGITARDLRQFVGRPQAVALIGQALYPRAFPRGAGLASANPWQAYAIRDYPRLGFLLLNNNVREIVLPIKHSQVANIHAMDALLLGCDRGAYVEARLVAFPNDGLAYLAEPGLQECAEK